MRVVRFGLTTLGGLAGLALLANAIFQAFMGTFASTLWSSFFGFLLAFSWIGITAWVLLA